MAQFPWMSTCRPLSTKAGTTDLEAEAACCLLRCRARGCTLPSLWVTRQLSYCRSTLEGASALSGTQQWLMPRLNTSKGTEEVRVRSV